MQATGREETRGTRSPDPSSQNPSPRSPRLGGWSPALEIVGLWTLAVVLPLFDLIGSEAPFLLHHRADSLDLALTILALALGLPIFLLLLESLAGRFLGSAARYRTHLAVLAALMAMLLLGVLRKLGDPMPAWLLPPVVGGLIWAAFRALDRWPVLTAACRLLSLALPITIGLLWTSPAARATRLAASGADTASPSATQATPSGHLPPVVWVIFDELPLLSIVDADLSIDSEMFPNLAAFADQATWYRNATTIWSSTAESVVSMLTGTVAEAKTPPTRDSYPDNLLTWLAPTHQIRSLEMITSLAPPAVADLRRRPSRSARLAGLLSDTAIVVAHMLAPPALAGALPPVDNRWGGFADQRVVRAQTGGLTKATQRNPWDFALADARDRQFTRFLDSMQEGERPGLYFLHLMLPHMPFRYLPSGRVYGGRPAAQRPAEAWLEDEWFALQTYQRHLLQAAFVDRLIGDLRARLEETGLWERAIVVITSDHGVSHWPGEDRRLPSETDHPDDILRVPLLIRAPGQVEGRVDDLPARTVDILPTLATHLATESLPWAHDGEALVEGREPARSRNLHHPRGEPIAFEATVTPDPLSLERKLALFDPRDGPWRWTRLGPFGHLVGESIDSLLLSAPRDSCIAVVDQLPVLESHDPSARYSPAYLTGTIDCRRQPPTGAHLAVALNRTLAGTTEVRPAGGDQRAFAVMTAEAALRPGRNRIDLLLLTGEPDRPHIEPVEVADPND